MTLEQLRIFVMVAEREHVTAAALALNLSQSAVSNALSSLEGRHGVRLFDRIGRGVRLNEAGRAFLPEAWAVLARADGAQAVLADLTQLNRGRLLIFASQTIASYWLPGRLVAFHTLHPGIELSVSIGNTHEAMQAVRDGAAELGFVEGEVDEPTLSLEVVGYDQLVVLVRPDHPWARRAQIGPQDILATPWVLREQGSGTRSSLEDALTNLDVAPGRLQVVMTLPSNDAVLAAAEAGAGAAALSTSVAAASLAAGRLVRAPLDLPPRPFRIIRHKARHRTRAADAFVAEAVHGLAPPPGGGG
ncbi:MAG TPA: LysR family transcriptional regulator [Phenylobacterium sp.]|jgi:DNA-binding transcriptional LysR family regulator|nr:LysR family transcriptional regulator [Phenylobacterium sp.]